MMRDIDEEEAACNLETNIASPTDYSILGTSTVGDNGTYAYDDDFSEIDIPDTPSIAMKANFFPADNRSIQGDNVSVGSSFMDYTYSNNYNDESTIATTTKRPDTFTPYSHETNDSNKKFFSSASITRPAPIVIEDDNDIGDESSDNKECIPLWISNASNSIKLVIVLATAMLLASLALVSITASVSGTEDSSRNIDSGSSSNTFGFVTAPPVTSDAEIFIVTSEPTKSPELVHIPISPSHIPSNAPITRSPTMAPTYAPVTLPPTSSPTLMPVTNSPTNYPSTSPIISPPTTSPSETETISPSTQLSSTPSTFLPTTHEPTRETPSPTEESTSSPSTQLSSTPSTFLPTTYEPTRETPSPTEESSSKPSTNLPTVEASNKPSTSSPTGNITNNPSTAMPSYEPSSVSPTNVPSMLSTLQPSASVIPTQVPTIEKNEVSFFVLSGNANTPELAAKLGELPVNDGEWLVHLGNWNDVEANSCIEENYELIAETYSNTSVPVYFVPGENEWNNCPNYNVEDETQTLWTDNLVWYEWEHWDMDKKRRGYEMKRQKEREENFSFMYNEALYIGLNMVDGQQWNTNAWNQRLSANAKYVIEAVEKNEDAKLIVIFASAGSTTNNIPFFSILKDKVIEWTGKGRELNFLYITQSNEPLGYSRDVFGIKNFLELKVQNNQFPPTKITLDTNRYKMVFDDSKWFES